MERMWHVCFRTAGQFLSRNITYDVSWNVGVPLWPQCCPTPLVIFECHLNQCTRKPVYNYPSLQSNRGIKIISTFFHGFRMLCVIQKQNQHANQEMIALCIVWNIAKNRLAFQIIHLRSVQMISPLHGVPWHSQASPSKAWTLDCFILSPSVFVVVLKSIQKTMSSCHRWLKTVPEVDVKSLLLEKEV